MSEKNFRECTFIELNEAFQLHKIKSPEMQRGTTFHFSGIGVVNTACKEFFLLNFSHQSKLTSFTDTVKMHSGNIPAAENSLYLLPIVESNVSQCIHPIITY